MSLGSSAGGNPGQVFQTGGVVTVSGSNDGNIRSLVIGEFAGESSVYSLSGGTLSVPNGPTYVNWNANAGSLNISGGLAKLNTVAFGTNTGAYTGYLNLSGTGSLYIGSGGMLSGRIDGNHQPERRYAGGVRKLVVQLANEPWRRGYHR